MSHVSHVREGRIWVAAEAAVVVEKEKDVDVGWTLGAVADGDGAPMHALSGLLPFSPDFDHHLSQNSDILEAAHIPTINTSSSLFELFSELRLA